MNTNESQTLARDMKCHCTGFIVCFANPTDCRYHKQCVRLKHIPTYYTSTSELAKELSKLKTGADHE